MKRFRKNRESHKKEHILKRLIQYPQESFANEGGRLFCMCCSTEVNPKKKSTLINHIHGNLNRLKSNETENVPSQQQSQHKKNLDLWNKKITRQETFVSYITDAKQGYLTYQIEKLIYIYIIIYVLSFLSTRGCFLWRIY